MKGSDRQPTYAFEGFRLDVRRRILSRADGEPIPLAPKVFDTLLYLVERPGQLLGKRQLIEAVWPDVIVEENNLNQCISTLRRTLGEHPGEHRFIVTEPGRGYRFVATVLTLSAESAESEGRGADAVPRDTRPVVRLHSVPARIAALAAVAALAALVLALVWPLGSDRASGGLSSNFSEAETETRGLLPISVAVLPFENLTADPDSAYVAAGMNVEIISQLSKLHNVNVIARDAVRSYADVNDRPPLSEIAAHLRVGSLLVGTVRYADNRIRLNVQLVDPTSETNLWASDYDLDFTDAFSGQADIAMNVANTLDAELSTRERERLEKPPTNSPEAYAAYLRAFAARDAGDRREALRLLELATDEDPDFALAHAQVALLYARSLIDWLYDPAVPLEPGNLQRRVQENVERALALDPELAIAHLALAEMQMYVWRWTEAAAQFERAYELNPNDLDVLRFYGEFNIWRGNYTDAITMGEKIRSLNPSALTNLWVAYVYSGDVEAALRVLNRQMTVDPRLSIAHLNFGFMDARRGEMDKAARAFRLVEQLSPLGPSGTANLAHAYARIGQPEDARRLFETVEHMSGEQRISAGTWAMAHLAIGANDQALRWLDKAIEKIENHEADTGWHSMMIIKANVTADPVLDEPRFTERRDKIRGN